MACQYIHEQVLAAMPTADTPRGFDSVIKDLGEIRSSDLCVAGNGLAMDVTGVMNMVVGLQGGVGLSHADVSRFSVFYKECCSRFVYFYHYSLTQSGAAGAKDMYGLRALMHHYEAIEDSVTNNRKVPPEAVRQLQSYSWALTPAQAKTTKEWLSIALRNHAAGYVPASIEDKAVDGGGLKFVGDDIPLVSYIKPLAHAASKSSAASSVSSKVLKAVQTITKDTTQPNVMKFFTAKKKVVVG